MELRKLVIQTLLEAQICLHETQSITEGLTPTDERRYERVRADLGTMIARLEAMTDEMFAHAVRYRQETTAPAPREL